MTDDLVKRLQEVEGGNHYGATVWYKNLDGPEAAERIEQLEAALHEWDALIRYQYSGSNEAMTALTEAAQYTAALLPGTGEWPGMTRMQQLEAALREIDKTSDNWVNMSYEMSTLAIKNITRAALKGKKDDAD